MTKQLNLFYDILPEVLVSEIYQYDNTYRIFNTNKFKKELSDIFITLPTTKKQCIRKITNYLDSFIDDAYWHNEYGRFDTDDTHNDKSLPNYQSTDEFFISLHPIGDALYYKILPKGSTPDNCSFLREPKNFDGYFLDEYKDTTYTQYDFDPLCLGRRTDCIESYDSNYNLIDARLGMYFA